MPHIQYEDYNPRARSKKILGHCQDVLEEYEEEGLRLTVRQLFYQMVARDVIPNSQAQYNRLQRIVKRGRRSGYLDWERIVDRGRSLRQRKRWSGPQEIIEASARGFHIDLWANQEHRPEVWIEKSALVEVIEGTCKAWDVPYISTRGYVSDSAAWRASQRYRDVMNGRVSERDDPAVEKDEQEDIEQVPVILHLSDHDPSGIDMRRDLEEKFELFGLRFPIRRIALTKRQIEAHQPPPNYAKASDSRADEYVAEHGRECWELDALDPSVIQEVVRDAIAEHISDEEAFQRRKEQRKAGRERLKEVSERWPELFGEGK
jgi:hypothetical protein